MNEGTQPRRLECPSDVKIQNNMDEGLSDCHITPLGYPEAEHDYVERILELLLD